MSWPHSPSSSWSPSGAGVLLGTSLSTSRRPLTHALESFKDRAVDVRLWGAPPPGLSGATIVLTSVNALGAGAHVLFDVQGDGSANLKLAQPRDHALASDGVAMGSAKYVQWNGRRLPRETGAPAVVIARAGIERPGLLRSRDP